MAHFLVPPNGSGVGYDVDSKLAPGSVWRMQVPLGSAHDITLGGGAGLFVRSNNPGVVPNAFSESQNGDLRVFTLGGAALGTSMLEAGKGEQIWISLQVQVVSPAALLVQLIPRPNRGTLNPGLSAADNHLMLQLFGAPRSTYSKTDQPLTNPRLKRNMTTASVGPFRAHGMAPAVDSLRMVMTDIRAHQPDVYRILGSIGMLVCRYMSDSTKLISMHSWGTAIDLTLNRVRDKRDDGKVQYGLTLIAPIFNRHGWYWGGGFPTEDGMHFEGSRAAVSKWATQLVP